MHFNFSAIIIGSVPKISFAYYFILYSVRCLGVSTGKLFIDNSSF